MYATSSSPTQTLSFLQRRHSPLSLTPNLTLPTLAHLPRALSSLHSRVTHLHTRCLYCTEVPSVQPSSRFLLVNTSSPLLGLHLRWADPMHIPTLTYILSSPPQRVLRACAAAQNFGLAAAAPSQAGSPWVSPHLSEIVTAGTQKTMMTSREGARHRRGNPSTHLMMTTTKTTRGPHIPPAGHPCPTHFPTLIFAQTVMATATHTHVLPKTYRALYPCNLYHRLRKTHKTKRALIPRSSRG